MKKKCIAITLGDPAGVGPEVVLKALARRAVRSKASFVVLGSPEVLTTTQRRLRLKLSWHTCVDLSESPRFAVRVIDPCPLGGRTVIPGTWSTLTGRASMRYVDHAIELCLNHSVDAMVTAPICKAAWKRASCGFPGHTEFLAERTGTTNFVMMLAGGGLRVALVTIHERLRSVPALINRKLIVDAARVLHHDLKRYFGYRRPRIAVLGLNPHAGEGGLMGDEEKRFILPALRLLRKDKINVIGPVPADTAFCQALRGEYDAILAMYHDQGLGPLKTLAFDTGVNVTLGLPIIRTSVDHGTAFNIAGKNVASEMSCVNAIEMAIEMTRHAR